MAALAKLKVAHDMAKDLIPFSMILSGIHYKLGATQLELGLLMEAKYYIRGRRMNILLTCHQEKLRALATTCGAPWQRG